MGLWHGGNHCMDGGNYSMDGVLQGKLSYGTILTHTLWLPLGWGLVVGNRGFCANQPTNQPTSPVSPAQPAQPSQPILWGYLWALWHASSL